MANVILPNGARLYVDHAHPEYSSPEVTNPLDVVRWDKAGELVMLEAVRRRADDAGRQRRRSTSTRTTPTTRARPTAPTRTTCAAATPRSPRWCATSSRSSSPGRSCAVPGRVGLGQDGRTTGFQISQRADFFEVEVGLETTLKRPIVNTRDEPHADADRYRRLHVIIGDANMSEISTYLKVGTTALVLAMIEANVLADDLAIAQPVRELHDGLATTPSLRHAHPARRRPHDHRAGPAGRVPRPGPQVRRRPLRRRRRRADRRRARPVGVGAHPARHRPDAAGRASSTGSPSCGCSRATATATASTGTAPRAAAGRPAVLRRPAREGPVPPAGLARRDADAARPDDAADAAVDAAARGHPRVLPRRVPAPLRRRRSPRRPGTR